MWHIRVKDNIQGWSFFGGRVGGSPPPPMLGEEVTSWSKIKKPLDQN